MEIKPYLSKPNGFTLIEILISLTISLVVIGGIYSVYDKQQMSYSTQEQISEMDQTADFLMDLLTKDIRMAGYDPTLSGYTRIGDGAGNNVTGTTLQIGVDWDGDGIDLANDNDESITYSLNGTQILRTTNTSPQGEVIAENVLNLSFRYDLIADGSGVNGNSGGQAYGNGIDDDCDGTADNAGEFLTLPSLNCLVLLNAYYPSTAELQYIRNIRISFTLRTKYPDSSYTNPDGVNGQYRTIQLTSRVKPRNIGL